MLKKRKLALQNSFCEKDRRLQGVCRGEKFFARRLPRYFLPCFFIIFLEIALTERAQALCNRFYQVC